MADNHKDEFESLIGMLQKAVIIDDSLNPILERANSVKDKLDNSDESIDLESHLIYIRELLTRSLNIDKSKMRTSYAPLHRVMKKYDIDVTHVCNALGLTKTVRTKLVNNKPVESSVLNQIAALLHCELDDIVEFISEEEHERRKNFGKLIKDEPDLISYIMKTDGDHKPTDDSLYFLKYENYLHENTINSINNAEYKAFIKRFSAKILEEISNKDYDD